MNNHNQPVMFDSFHSSMPSLSASPAALQVSMPYSMPTSQFNFNNFNQQHQPQQQHQRKRQRDAVTADHDHDIDIDTAAQFLTSHHNHSAYNAANIYSGENACNRSDDSTVFNKHGSRTNGNNDKHVSFVPLERKNQIFKRRQFARIESELHAKTVSMLFQGQKEYLKRCKDQNQHNNDINTDDDISMSTTSTTPMQQAQEKSYKQKPFWPQIVKTSVQSQQLQQQRNQYYDNSMAISALCQVCEKDLSHMDPTDVNEFQCMNCGKMLCGLCSFVNGDINCCFDCRDM